MDQPILPNSPDARTADGTLIDQATPPTPSTTQTPTPTEPSTNAPTTPTGAPATYAEFTAPDGAKLSPTTIESATPIFRELGLNQAQPQRLVDFYAAQQKSVTDGIETMRQQWRDEVTADPSLGPKIDGIKINIGRMYDAIDDAKLVGEFKTAMTDYAIGDNPTFIKMFAKIAEKFSEGTPVTGGKPTEPSQSRPGAPTRPTAAQALFPNLPTG